MANQQESGPEPGLLGTSQPLPGLLGLPELEGGVDADTEHEGSTHTTHTRTRTPQTLPGLWWNLQTQRHGRQTGGQQGA